MARKSFLLRINPDLWEDINRWAKDELRSVNGQMEFILRQAVEKRKHARRDKGGEESRESDNLGAKE